MAHYEKLICLLLGFSFTILCLISFAPVTTAIQIGNDEHYELTKALLCSKGFRLYDQVWNDQPPVYTILLASVFKVFGHQIAVARSVAVMFGLSFFAAFASIVRRKTGFLAASVSLCCLAAAPQVFELSISSMLEVPAIGTALWALLLLMKWEENGKTTHLVLSGVVLAIGLQIKLTAAIAAPPLFVEILLVQASSNYSYRSRLRQLAIWIGSLTATYGFVAVVFGSVPINVLMDSHFSDLSQNAARNLGLSFSPAILLNNMEGVIGATVAFCLLLIRMEWRSLGYPLVWLLTALLLHTHHHPWWSYYSLHFAIPFAWLSGNAVSALFLFKRNHITSQWAVLVRHLLGIALLSVMFSYGAERLFLEVQRVRKLPTVDSFPIIKVLRANGALSDTIYTRDTVYAFVAGLTVLPGLAVLPQKRFWSHQISEEAIWDRVKMQLPQQILLPRAFSPPYIRPFLATHYVLVYSDGDHDLYIRSLSRDH